jgi:hypothetical protein
MAMDLRYHDFTAGTLTSVKIEPSLWYAIRLPAPCGDAALMTAIQLLRRLRESRLQLRPFRLERRGEQAVRHGPWLQ